MEFDFDEWARLAREDKEEFERRRKELLEQVHASAPLHMQQRLRGLQFRIDLHRQRAKTPLGACVQLNSMMWESFSRLKGSLEDFVKVSTQLPQPQPEKTPSSATVLPFSKAERKKEQ